MTCDLFMKPGKRLLMLMNSEFFTYQVGLDTGFRDTLSLKIIELVCTKLLLCLLLILKDNSRLCLENLLRLLRV